jgi:type VI secretion system protein ImpL
MQQAEILHSNVTKLPPPVNAWVEKVADAARGDANAISLAQLSDDLTQNVTSECRRVVANHYPFVGKAPDVPLGDFGRLFAPNGIIDRFFVANIAPMVNMSGGSWSWKPSAQIGRKLSDATLRSFRQAAEIKDTFFAGGAQPSVNFDVRMLSLDSNSTSVTLALSGGQPFLYQSASAIAAANAAAAPAPSPSSSGFGAAPPPAPSPTPSLPAPTATSTAGQIQWPGAGDVTISWQPESSDSKSSIERQGPWALFHLVDAYSPTQAGAAVVVSFALGSHYVRYQFKASTNANPLTLPALRQFTCPVGL